MKEIHDNYKQALVGKSVLILHATDKFYDPKINWEYFNTVDLFAEGTHFKKIHCENDLVAKNNYCASGMLVNWYLIFTYIANNYINKSITKLKLKYDILVEKDCWLSWLDYLAGHKFNSVFRINTNTANL